VKKIEFTDEQIEEMVGKPISGKLSPEKIVRAVGLYRDGFSLEEIGKMMNVSASAIHYRISKVVSTKKQRTLSEGDENEIVALYKDGLSACKIGKRYNVSDTWIYKVLDRLNVARRSLSEAAKGDRGIDETKRKKIIELFDDGRSIREIHKVLGISKSLVRRRIKEMGREIEEPYQVIRKYFYNQGFFEKIDSGEKAYWYGFCMADSGVDSVRKKFSIGLAIKDYNHLVKFKKSIGADDTPIKDHNHGRGCVIVLNSIKMLNDLKRLGIVDRKSLIVEYPDRMILPEEFERDFVRGLIDGDGSLSFSVFYNRYRMPSISLVGTYSICNGVRDVLSENLGVKKNKIIQRKKIFSVRWASMEEVRKICEWLYKEDDIYLDRKFHKSKEIIECVEKRVFYHKEKRPLNDKQILEAKRLYVDEKLSCRKISDIFGGIHEDTVRNYLKKEGVNIRRPGKYKT